METKVTNIAKGAKFAQFDFVTPITEAAKKGIWTVNGVEFSFTAQKQLADIITAAAGTNDVVFLDALNVAEIKNIDNKLLAKYKSAIDSPVAPATAPKTLADVQKVVNDVNAKEANAEAKIKPVLDAKNQIDLLAALQANFKRVNKDWIEKYITADGTTTAGIQIVAAPGANTVHPTAAAAVTPVTEKVIQDTIDAVNLAAITSMDSAVTGAKLLASEQAKVTAAIQAYQKDDEGTDKTKANAIKASQVKEAVLRVKEAKTQNAVYTSLVNLATLDNDTLKVSDLNASLAKFYFDAQKVLTNELDTKAVADVKTNVITKASTGANALALKDAMTDITAKYGTVVAASGDTAANRTALKASLQKLADYTSHLTGTAKFDMSIVKDANLAKYATAFNTATKISATSTVADVKGKIDAVNSSQNLDAAVATINKSTSTPVEIRAAISEIVVTLLANPANNTEAEKYINLTAQAKLEVAGLVKEARKANLAVDFDIDDIFDATNGSGAVDTAVDAQIAKVKDFNDIGDLDGTTTTKTKTQLDKYANDHDVKNDAYLALSAQEKLSVAVEINKLVHTDKDGVKTPYNFSAKDAVSSFAEADAIIAAAIAKVK